MAQWRILDQIMLSGLRLYVPVVFPAPPNPCLKRNLLLSSACLLEGLLPACLSHHSQTTNLIKLNGSQPQSHQSDLLVPLEAVLETEIDRYR